MKVKQPFNSTSKSEKRLRLLFYLLTAYILLQFSWWAYLLIDLNKKYFAGQGDDTVRLKVLMVAGEGAVFLTFLLAGIYIMQRTIRKDIALVRQQRNFLLSITHELKTPVAAIKLCLQTLEKRVGLDASQRAPLQKTAIDNTERLHNLIDNVLLATRLESGQQVIFRERTDVSGLCRELCEGVLHTVAGKDGLHTRISPGIVGNVDANAFESMVVNLVENGVKYAGNAPVTVELAREQKYLLLRVADLGSGIPAEDKSKIFQKFYRMGNEETRSKKGTGLGLFIVNQLVEMHNGSILVKNNSPSGTIFEVKLPLS